jgi:RNA recognition motif-containing protein
MSLSISNVGSTGLILSFELPWKARWQDLKDLVRYYSYNIERAEVYLMPDGRSRGFGFVRIRGREDATRVVGELLLRILYSRLCKFLTKSQSIRKSGRI